MKHTVVVTGGNGPFILSQLFEKAPCRTDPSVLVPFGTRIFAMPYGYQSDEERTGPKYRRVRPELFWFKASTAKVAAARRRAAQRGPQETPGAPVARY